MPEIKHTFTGGKMNKDLDERLVPNGEYRDAMNIQVATSEGSDVATAQNILGNKKINIIPFGDPDSPFNFNSSFTTIATVADEINDKMYSIIHGPNVDYVVEYNENGGKFVLIDSNKDVLKLRQNRIITGINIVDGMLFFTDNANEPKKINIQRCIEGTTQDGTTHTKLINNKAEITLADNIDLEEKHITVIRKAPTIAPTMKLNTSREAGVVYTGVVQIATTDNPGDSDILGVDKDADGTIDINPPDFSNVQVNDIITLVLDKYLLNGVVTNGSLLDLDGWGTTTNSTSNIHGKKVVLQAFTEGPPALPPGLPLTNFTLKGVITGSQSSTNRVDVEITSIDGFPPSVVDGDTRNYVVDLFDENEKLFEFKFPRFAYRYKFEDGEYSPFSPFTQVAFAPGSFDYHPRKGYNLGLTNRLTRIDLGNIINDKTPKDVASIDILFKEEPSPNIYIVDTIKPSDDIEITGNTNTWDRLSADVLNEYFQITTETISSVVPSNQLLRPWDSVPKRAKAQEVTASRLIYGNYVQNYDLINVDNDNEYVPRLDVKITDRLDAYSASEENYAATKKSIKSLREYQLGVVFLDKYGRETPVLSNTSGTLKLEKEEALRRTQLKVNFNSDDRPRGLTHFKFFVKETSNEYYNMAMDRWYNAEDDNIWLAFPSSDRNKLDIDTFLILKKGSDSNDLVKESARYKVLAIENQAPDHIKTSKLLISRTSNVGNNVLSNSNAPFFGAREFKMNYQPFLGSAGQNLHTIFDDQLYVSFEKDGQFSDRYRIASITTDFNENDGGTGISNAGTARYTVRLVESLRQDVNFITNDSTGTNSNVIEDCFVNVHRYKVENKPQFDGRFFVKIYYDEIFKNEVVLSSAADLEKRVAASQKIFSMRADNIERQTSKHERYYLGDTHNNFGVNWHKFPNTTSHGTSFSTATTGGLGSTSTSNESRHWYKYGYYNIDSFSSFAFYFRRYEVFRKPLTGGPNNIYPLVLHLKKGDASNNVVQYQESHNVSEFWDYSGNASNVGDGDDGDRWGEFGLDPNNSVYDVSFPLNGYTANWSDGEEANNSKINDVLQSDKISARDSEVWFIDAGPYVNEQQNNNLVWDNDYLDPDNGPLIYEDPSNARAPLFGNGITTPRIGSSFSMELAFGGIYTDHVYRNSVGGGTDPGVADVSDNHFNIGNWASYGSARQDYNDGSIKDVTNFLRNGAEFRIKEDFQKTIYTINGTITSKSKIRHSNKLHYNNSEYVSEQKNSMAELLSFNFTKNWNITGIEGNSLFASKMMQFGKITTGNGGTEIILTSCSDAGDTLTGTTAIGSNVHDDLKIFVTDIVDGNNKMLLEGMALQKYTHDAASRNLTDSDALGTSGQDFLVVRKINKLTQGDVEFFELILGGYDGHLIQDNHDKLTSVNPPDINTEYKFCQVGMNGYSANSEFNINTIPKRVDETANGFEGNADLVGAIGAVGFTIEFLEDIEPEEILSTNPAIWETEPKDTKDLDIYYESTGAIPIILDENNVQEAFPIGSVLENTGNYHVLTGYSGKDLEFDTLPTITNLPKPRKIHRPDGLTIKTDVLSVSGNIVTVANFVYDDTFYLPWFNCYSFGNGVESNRIRDNFNLPFISNGVKVSTVLEGDYKEERRKYGLIYSGIYNSISGVNNLNQFIQAEKITKDVNPVYGSIQKLHTRDSDLIALCEDKILKILAQKDALFNADGNTNVTATSNVLGQTIPFGGEYGISTNPESFASEDYRIYFSDKVRGSIMRLSRDGLTAISDAGMKSYFRDNLKLTNKVIGSYDDRKGEYNVKLQYDSNGTYTTNSKDNYVISFSEKVRGWVSFKSFTDMQQGVSMANNYYTFNNGNCYIHHSKDVDRNTFYGNYANSSIDVMLNDSPSEIKVYNTLNYEGSQSKIDKFVTQVVGDTTYSDQEFYNLYAKEGWHVESIITDKEQGSVNEFKEKEGKWFNTINRDVQLGVDVISTGEFSFQGIGLASSTGSATIDDDGDIVDPISLDFGDPVSLDASDDVTDPVDIINVDPVDPISTNNVTNTDPVVSASGRDNIEPDDDTTSVAASLSTTSKSVKQDLLEEELKNRATRTQTQTRRTY